MLGKTVKQASHFPFDKSGGLRLIGHPDERYAEPLVIGEGLGKDLEQDVAVLAPRLAQLPFGTVAVNSMFEASFGHRHKHLHTRLGCRELLTQGDETYRKSVQRPFAVGEEFFQLLLAAESLGLGEAISSCWHHRCKH